MATTKTPHAPGIQREAIAEMVRHYYRTVGADHLTSAAEDGLALFDRLFHAVSRLVGNENIEGDLFDCGAMDAARRAIAEIEGRRI